MPHRRLKAIRAQSASFHTRVAGAAVLTTMVVLLAACGIFMSQQWAVAGHVNHRNHEALAAIAADLAAPGLAAHDQTLTQRTVDSLASAPRILRAVVADAGGDVIATYQRSATVDPAVPNETITTSVKLDGVRVGALTLIVRQPSVWVMLPQFLALTGALFFGGIGVALILARVLTFRIVAPVQHLAEAMGEVASKANFEPVAIRAEDGLFRSLAESFNNLLSTLDDRDKALQKSLHDLAAARDAADAANTLKSQFLANMSHEIRTPLNGVLAMAEVMSRDDLSSAQGERLAIVRQSGALLLSVLNDVLDLSKIEAGKLSLAETPFDLDQAMTSSRDIFAFQAQAKGLTFSFDIAPEAQGAWRGDADRLHQIVGNLLSNAIKFTQTGEVETRFDLAPDTGSLRLTVRDTGIGIPLAKQGNLFEKFIQVDNSATRRFGGTGLGLAICRELTVMMGGSISVESHEGQGSIFIAQFPLARGELGSGLAAAPAIPLEANGANLRVLAAEDNDTNQQVLAAVMGALGIEVEIVADGQAAFEAWRDGTFDVVLMDVQMPVMDGMDSARAIRAAELELGRARTPIVALTANALAHQVEEYLAAGMDGHVAKPIEIAKLYEAIGQALTAVAQDRGPSDLQIEKTG